MKQEYLKKFSLSYWELTIWENGTKENQFEKCKDKLSLNQIFNFLQIFFNFEVINQL